MLRVAFNEYEFQRFNVHQNKNYDCTELENLISFDGFKPNLTLQNFECLQMMNDLSRSFCLSRRPEQFWTIATALEDDLGRVNVGRGLGQPKIYLAEKRGKFIQYYFKFVVSDADHQFSYRKLVSLTKEGSMLHTESVNLEPTIPHISATYPIKRAKYNGACAISKARSYRAYNIFKGTLTGLELLEGLRNNITNEYPIQYLNMSHTTITTGKVVCYNTFILNGICLKDSADFLMHKALFMNNPPLQLTVTCVCFECQIFRREFTDEDDYYEEIAKIPLLIHPVACECFVCEVCSSDVSDSDIQSTAVGPSVNESSSDDSDKENH